MEKIIETELSLEDILKIKLTNEDLISTIEVDGEDNLNILNLVLENLISSSLKFQELEDKYFEEEKMFSYFAKYKIIEDCKLKVEIFDITNVSNCQCEEIIND